MQKKLYIQQNIYYQKLLKLSFFIFLAIIYINCFTTSTSYAYNVNQYVNILSNNTNSLPNQTRNYTQWFLSNFIYTKDYFVFDENNDLIIMCPSYYTRDSEYEYDIYYINLNGHKFAWSNNGSKPQVLFSGSVRVHRYDIFVKSNGTLSSTISNSTYNATRIDLNRANTSDFNSVVIVGSSLMQNSSYNGTTSQTYYFKQVFDVAPQFVKNNDGVLNYREQSKKLGYIDNFTTEDDVNFLLVDPNALYDSIIATVGDGLIMVEDNVYVDTRKIRPNKIYDLYFYYNNELNEIYQYYWYYESGDSGYELIDSTYDIIDNNNQNTQEVIQNQNQNTQEVINTITESGDISGDIANFFTELSGDFAGFFGYNDFSGDDFKDFNMVANAVTTLYSNIQQSLITSGDVVYTFPYMKTTITLHSRDFVTPNNGLKSFVSSFLVFGTVALFYKYLLHIFHKAKEGSISGVSSSIEVDDESLLM